MMIREWKFEDILAVSRLEEECFGSEKWSYKTLVACFENPLFFGAVAEEGGEIVGYGGVTAAGESADLENLLVAESYRRSGWGGKLLSVLMTRAEQAGAEKMFLEVRVSNSAAMRLYLSFGFTGVYARTRYYDDGEDCLVMCKNF